jgi:hypothetical protein
MPPQAPEPFSGSAPEFIDVKRLVFALTIFFISGIALDGASGLLGLVEGVFFPEFAGKSEITTQGEGIFALALVVVSILSIVIFLGTSISYCMWVYRSHKNLSSFKAAHLNFTPGWAVGWFFVPVMMLWKPFQAVVEITCASHPEADTENWPAQQTPTLLKWWWAAWIISQVLNRVDLKIAMSKDPATVALAPWFSAFTSLPNMAAGLLALMVVRLIYARQQEKAKILGLLPAAPDSSL